MSQGSQKRYSVRQRLGSAWLIWDSLTLTVESTWVNEENAKVQCEYLNAATASVKPVFGSLGDDYSCVGTDLVLVGAGSNPYVRSQAKSIMVGMPHKLYTPIVAMGEGAEWRIVDGKVVLHTPTLPTAAAVAPCSHKRERYVGLMESFDHCVKCGIKFKG